MTKDQLSLKNFMSAYFHEDWPVDFRSTHAAVASFVRDAEPSELTAVIQALRGLLGGGDDDATLSRRLFSEFGAYFDPLSVGESTSRWLKSIADEIESKLENQTQ